MSGLAERGQNDNMDTSEAERTNCLVGLRRSFRRDAGSARVNRVTRTRWKATWCQRHQALVGLPWSSRSTAVRRLRYLPTTLINPNMPSLKCGSTRQIARYVPGLWKWKTSTRSNGVVGFLGSGPR